MTFNLNHFLPAVVTIVCVVTASTGSATTYQLENTFDVVQFSQIVGATDQEEYDEIKSDIPFTFGNAIDTGYTPELGDLPFIPGGGSFFFDPDAVGYITGGGQIEASFVFDGSSLNGQNYANGDYDAINDGDTFVAVSELPMSSTIDFYDFLNGENADDGVMLAYTSEFSIGRVLVANDIEAFQTESVDFFDGIVVEAYLPDLTPDGDRVGFSLTLLGDGDWFENNPNFDLAEALSDGNLLQTSVSGVDYGFDEAVPPQQTWQSRFVGELVGDEFNIGVAIEGGGSEIDPFLPTSETEDSFEFDLTTIEINPDDIVWIDPDIAVGYTYSVVGDQIDSITAPSQASVPDGDGAYTVTIDGEEFTLLSGATLSLDNPVSTFILTGIDPALLLDPEDPLAFQIGLSFTGQGSGPIVTQTAIVETVAPAIPLPAGVWLLLTGGLAFFIPGFRRRDQAA